MPDDLTLHETADLLGVHYMTVYRYVRVGMLDATKSGHEWRVSRAAVERFRRAGRPGGPGRRAPWADRLEGRLLAGDGVGAWAVVEAALTSGTELDRVYLDVIAPAMVAIGERWHREEIDVADEHRASGLAMRIIGRLGHRCVRRGRHRGALVLGAPPGEVHSLPVAILADLLRLRGWEVSDLGADVPVPSFVVALGRVPGARALGVSVTSEENLGAAATVCSAVRAAVPGVLVVLGGQAIGGADHARSLGADAFADGAAALDELLTTSDPSRVETRTPVR